MKLAEALILRADRQKRLLQLKQRIAANATVQEGEEPAEKPESLIAELESVATELLGLIQRINRTNSNTPFSDAGMLSDVLAERDVLLLRRGAYLDLANAASPALSRYSRSEIKQARTVNVAEVQQKVDSLSKEYRELDARVQALNWATDLVD